MRTYDNYICTTAHTYQVFCISLTIIVVVLVFLVSIPANFFVCLGRGSLCQSTFFSKFGMFSDLNQYYALKLISLYFLELYRRAAKACRQFKEKQGLYINQNPQHKATVNSNVYLC